MENMVGQVWTADFVVQIVNDIQYLLHDWQNYIYSKIRIKELQYHIIGKNKQFFYLILPMATRKNITEMEF